MTEINPTVQKFVNRSLTTDGDQSMPLEELWHEYEQRYPSGVPRERIRWHLEEAGVKTEAMTEGVVVYAEISLASGFNV